MFEKPKNQDLVANSFGNRVHTTNRPALDGVGLATVDTTLKNPRNNVEESMSGMGKDSDRTIRRVYKG